MTLISSFKLNAITITGIYHLITDHINRHYDYYCVSERIRRVRQRPVSRRTGLLYATGRFCGHKGMLQTVQRYVKYGYREG